jgi:hypothetical protein
MEFCSTIQNGLCCTKENQGMVLPFCFNFYAAF